MKYLMILIILTSTSAYATDTASVIGNISANVVTCTNMDDNGTVTDSSNQTPPDCAWMDDVWMCSY